MWNVIGGKYYSYLPICLTTILWNIYIYINFCLVTLIETLPIVVCFITHTCRKPIVYVMKF